jgi:hypothetical protein
MGRRTLMNSEKVKEIKKGLEVCTGICNETCPYDNLRCLTDLSKDILTLINELESENEMLKATKDRLTFADRIKLVDNAVENKLKQFAERLKEMAYKSTDWSHGEHPLVVEVDYIDEVLEEFLNK